MFILGLFWLVRCSGSRSSLFGSELRDSVLKFDELFVNEFNARVFWKVRKVQCLVLRNKIKVRKVQQVRILEITSLTHLYIRLAACLLALPGT